MSPLSLSRARPISLSLNFGAGHHQRLPSPQRRPADASTRLISFLLPFLVLFYTSSNYVMEAVIYEESPLADYLEGDANPFEPTDTLPPTPPQFAPTGLPRVRDRLRALRDTATSVASLSDERALERFRYIFVASQLLSDDVHPRTRPPDDDSCLTTSLTARRSCCHRPVFLRSLASALDSRSDSPCRSDRLVPATHLRCCHRLHHTLFDHCAPTSICKIH